MSNVGMQHQNGGLTMYHLCIDGFQTTNNTPKLITSIPIPVNKTYDIKVYMQAVKSDLTTRNAGDVRGVFSRAAGNISQDGSLVKGLIGVLSTAQVSFTINNTTKEVEAYANGTTATIDWNFDVEIIFNT